ncbi:MAG: DMT family transporter [Acidobacteria bacterium]|nr:DMT family transporter [Acidobacteriota bacterium]
MKSLFFTTVALTAFAANSLLCRMALGEGAMDAASFSTVRLASGAAMLLLIFLIFPRQRTSPRAGDWLSATMLFSYMVTFSYAYISLSTGTGALILFGMVQATMLLWALRSGERPHLMEWGGLTLALGGLVYLVFPGLAAPSPAGAFLMAVAGISWGVYSLRGRGSNRALADTTFNFVRALPLVLVVSLVALGDSHWSARGILLASLSGALASGLGYTCWYAALRYLAATRAAVVQLTVPVLAALGGTAFLAEEVTLRLVLSMVLILGGVALAMAAHRQAVPGKV